MWVESFLGVFLSAFQIAELSVSIVAHTVYLVSSAGWRYRQARFGPVGHVIYFSRLVDTDRLQEMHWQINVWTDEQIIAWRTSYIGTCNAVSVAGAIFATVGLTTLQLPNMYTVHWTARALCVVSMILGVLAVTLATEQQQELALLQNATAIRLWLSRGRPSPYVLSTNEFKLARQRRETGSQTDKYKHDGSFSGMPLESSIAVLTFVTMPRYLLNSSVGAFLVGIGLYLLFSWTDNTDDQPIANRNVFVVFIVLIGVFVFLHQYVFSFIIHNQHKKEIEFGLDNLGIDFNPNALSQLETELHQVRQRLKHLEQHKSRILEEGGRRHTEKNLDTDVRAEEDENSAGRAA